MALQHLRSGTANKRPIPTVMSAGQIAINTNEASPGLFFKDSNGDLVKVGPVHIGTSAPNSSPDSVAATALVTGTVYQILTVGTSDFTLVGASANTVGVIFTATGTTTGDGTVSGQQGVEKGEQWLDTTGGNYVLKIYDGTAWRSEAGEFVNVSGDTMTGALLLDNAASASAPDLSFDGDANTGIYSPGADQVALATNGTGRLFVDASGNIGLGTGSPAQKLHVAGGNPAMVLESTSSTGAFIQFRSTASPLGTNRLGYGSDDFLVDTNGTEKLRITSDGKVGVGTSTPGSFQAGANNLVVGTGSGDNGISIFAGASNEGRLYFARTGELIRGQVKYDFSADKMHFAVDSATKATLTSTGLGIGTTQVDSKLVVAGNNDGGGNQNTLRFVDLDTATINGQSMGRIEWYTSDTDEAGVKAYIEATTYVDARGGTLTLGTDGSASGAQNIVFKQKTNEVGRFDTSGRLLVGTSSARTNFFNAAVAPKLQIEGTSTSNDGPYAVVVDNANTANGPRWVLGKSRSTGNTIVQSGDRLGGIEYQGNDGAEFVSSANIECYVDGTPGANDMPGRLVFSTTADGASSPTERMRIKSNGDTNFWGGGPANTIHSVTTETAAKTYSLFWGGYGSSGPGNYGTNCVKIYTNGDIENTNNVYGSLSDSKLKENIVDASSQWQDIKDLRVRKYNFIEGQTHTQIGVVAQEVETVSPGLVSESPDRDEEGNDLGTVTKSVNYSVLYMKAVKALQEAMERIETLEAKVAALEAN